jgi:hypothetical protein
MNPLEMCICGSFCALQAKPQDCETVMLFMASAFQRLPSIAFIAPVNFDWLIANFCPIDLNDERFTGWLFDV